MDQGLVIRFVVCVAIIVAFLAASVTQFHVNIVGPVAVGGIALVMFWPRPTDTSGNEAEADAPEQVN